MVCDRNIVVAQLPRRFRHFLDGALTVAGSRVHVQIALDVLAANQVRQTVLLGRLDLSRVFANLRRNEIQFQLGVNFLFRATGNATLTLQRRQSVFVQRVAHIVRAAAQSDVMLARSGEIEQSSAKRFLVQEPHVDLNSVVQREAHLVFPVRQHLIDSWILQDVFRDSVDVLLRGEAIGKGQQQVQIAHRLFSAAQRSRRRDRCHAFPVFLNVIDDPIRGCLGDVLPKAAGGALERLNRLQNVLFALFAEARDIAQLAFQRKLLHVCNRRSFKIRPEKRYFLRSQRLQMQDIKQRDRILLQQLLPKAVVAGFQDFLQMFGHAFADSRQLFQLVGLFSQLLNRLMNSGNQLSGFFVAPVPANNGSVDFEELCGFAKYAGDSLVVHAPIIRLEGARRERPSRREGHGRSNREKKESQKEKTGKGGVFAGATKWQREPQPPGFCTLAACGPFGPCTISNSTGSPSCKVR